MSNRNEILINTTKTRARRGKSSKSVKSEENVAALTSPAAASEFCEKDCR